MTGLYIHIPFCAKKCGYCDFYSINYNSDTVKNYVEFLIEKIKNINTVFDTVYFGGGTPSIIGAENLSRILSCVKYKDNAEITVEVNPKGYKKAFFDEIYNAGFNRISIGMQSADDDELKLLTRIHSAQDVKNTVSDAKEAGFENISLDLMIGIENQTLESLQKSLDFCLNLDIKHLSCYMLKIEENTPFYEQKLNLPDEDKTAEMYLYMCDYLNENGFEHYEISNFAKNGYESKHNLIYWQLGDYLGLGPSAHSFLNGKRYYYPNDISYFLGGNKYIYLSDGGDVYDYIMLGLRLKQGINTAKIKENVSKKFFEKAKKYADLGYANLNNGSFSLNETGFLIQNTILTDLLEEIIWE